MIEQGEEALPVCGSAGNVPAGLYPTQTLYAYLCGNGR